MKCACPRAAAGGLAALVGRAAPSAAQNCSRRSAFLQAWEGRKPSFGQRQAWRAFIGSAGSASHSYRSRASPRLGGLSRRGAPCRLGGAHAGVPESAGSAAAETKRNIVAGGLLPLRWPAQEHPSMQRSSSRHPAEGLTCVRGQPQQRMHAGRAGALSMPAPGSPGACLQKCCCCRSRARGWGHRRAISTRGGAPRLPGGPDTCPGRGIVPAAAPTLGYMGAGTARGQPRGSHDGVAPSRGHLPPHALLRGLWRGARGVHWSIGRGTGGVLCCDEVRQRLAVLGTRMTGRQAASEPEHWAASHVHSQPLPAHCPLTAPPTSSRMRLISCFARLTTSAVGPAGPVCGRGTALLSQERRQDGASQAARAATAGANTGERAVTGGQAEAAALARTLDVQVELALVQGPGRGAQLVVLAWRREVGAGQGGGG